MSEPTPESLRALRKLYRETDREDECGCGTAFKGSHQGEAKCKLTSLDANVLETLESAALALERVAHLEGEIRRLDSALRNIRLSAAGGRAFGHGATLQTYPRMVERKEAALDRVLAMCAAVGIEASILRADDTALLSQEDQ